MQAGRDDPHYHQSASDRGQIEIVPGAPIRSVIGTHPQRLRPGNRVAPEPDVAQIARGIACGGIHIPAVGPPAVAAYVVPYLVIRHRVAIGVRDGHHIRQKRPLRNADRLIRHGDRGRRVALRAQYETVPVAPIRSVIDPEPERLVARGAVPTEPDIRKVGRLVSGRGIHISAIRPPAVAPWLS